METSLIPAALGQNVFSNDGAWQFLIFTALESLVWYQASTFQFWLPARIVAWSGLAFMITQAFLWHQHTLASSRAFLAMFSVSVWAHIPAFVLADYVIFCFLEMNDFYETNYYLKWLWVFPVVETLYQWWLFSMKSTMNDYL